MDLISNYTNLPRAYLGLSVFARGYSLKLDLEVDIVHDFAEEDDEIVMVLGYPFFPAGHPWVSFVFDFFCILIIILLWTIKAPSDGPVFNQFHLTQ